MPLSTLRRPFQGRPRPSLRRGGSGMRASSTAHWISVSSRTLRRGIRVGPDKLLWNCSKTSRVPGTHEDDELGHRRSTFRSTSHNVRPRHGTHAPRVSSKTVISGLAQTDGKADRADAVSGPKLGYSMTHSSPHFSVLICRAARRIQPRSCEKCKAPLKAVCLSLCCGMLVTIKGSSNDPPTEAMTSRPSCSKKPISRSYSGECQPGMYLKL